MNQFTARAFNRGYCDRDRFIDVHFSDLVRNPAGTVAGVYRALGWDYPESVEQGIADYATQKPKGSRGLHRYSLKDAGLDEAKERERFAPYMAHYGIEAEATSTR